MSEIDEEKYNQEWVDALNPSAAIKRKDQQIKDLTELVDVLYTSLYSKDWNEEMEARKKSMPLYDTYQQKYPKP